MKKAILFKTHFGTFDFILKAANGNTVGRSFPETYTQKHSAIETLQSCFADFEIVDKTSKVENDKPVIL